MPRRAALNLPNLLVVSLALTIVALTIVALAAPALAKSGRAPSPQAKALREAGDLVPYAPSHTVLEALFTADEDAPRGVFGPIAAYAKSRSCPTAWLIEKGELTRIKELAARKDIPPFEFSLTLEEDCPDRVTHAVFVTAPGSTPEAWLKWRSQFHGRKAEGHYGAALAGMNRAAAAGLTPTAQLRAEGRLRPVFDLEKGERTGR